LDFKNIKTNRLYEDLAWLWPLISKPEDYASEAAFWRKALKEKLGEGRHHLLEMGVGGGNNLSHLTKDFNATACDISGEIMEHSRRLNPDVDHHVGDMRSIRLGKKFDAVIIHDAISYMLTEDDLRNTFITAAEHLDKGGVFITTPDYLKETFTEGSVSHDHESDGNIELVHIQYDFDPDPEDTNFETLMTYLILQNGKLQVEHDRHSCGLFPKQTWIKLMAEARFEVETRDYPVHDDQRDSWLFVGVKK